MQFLSSEIFKKSSIKKSSGITVDENLYLICDEKYKVDNL